MNKKQLLEARKALMARYAAAQTAEELDKLDNELRSINAQIAICEAEEAEQRAAEAAAPDVRPVAEETPAPVLRSIASMEAEVQRRGNLENDIFGTEEYRMAFRNYVVNGIAIPSQYTEQRDDAFTLVTEAAAMIPTTILNRVVTNLKAAGKLFERATQTSYQGGVAIPVADLNPTFTWMGAAETPSDYEKAVADKSVTFGYHLLQGRIALGLLASTVSLPIFEDTIVSALTVGAIRAMETAMVSGTGSRQPKGILTYTVDAAHTVEMNDANVKTAEAWFEVEGCIEDAYDNDNLVVLMNKKTFTMLQGVPANTDGQKIATVVNGVRYVNNRLCITTDLIKSYTAASTGDIFAATCDLSQYMINSNMNMFYKKFYDENAEQWKHKILMIADGKLAAYQDTAKMIGAGHLVYIKKKANG